VTPRSAIVSRIAHQASFDAPVHRPGARWWDELPADFARAPEIFELELLESMQVRAGAAWDTTVRTLAGTAVSALAYPVGFHPLALKRALDDRELIGPMVEGRDPDAFFRRPPPLVPITVRDARLPLFRPPDGACLDLRFTSPYVPVNPRIRKDYLSHRGNRTGHARWWKHQQGPRPTIIAIHGFNADLYHLNELFFAIPWLYRLGFDVVLYTLPFHGPRRTRFSPFSGHGFFAGGIARINEAFGQAIFDLRILMDHLLLTHEVPRVGVTGVSLGGFTAALLASVDARLAFSIPNVPVVSLADLMMEWGPLGTLMRGSLLVLRRRIQDARFLLAVTSPLTYAPRIDKSRLMVIGGVGDRLAPPQQARLLWEHWDRCRLHWFPGNHVMHFDRGTYLREMARFMKSVGFFEGLPGPRQLKSERRRRLLPSFRRR
jgi:pimeloyl-ACP methyl ester carboxylesterase